MKRIKHKKDCKANTHWERCRRAASFGKRDIVWFNHNTDRKIDGILTRYKSIEKSLDKEVNE